MRKRRHHEVRVALGPVKGERTVSELAAEYGLHPTMIHQWIQLSSAIGSRTMTSALLDRAADIFERGGRRPVAEVDEEMVRSLH